MKSPKVQESGPTCPELLTYLWQWFTDILSGCGGGFGSASIRWADLLAWAEMTGNRPEPWETAALMRLSSTYAAVRAAEQK